MHTKRLLDKSQHVAKIGHWEWRLRHDRITYSDGYRRLYGFGPDEVVSVVAAIAMIHPDDYARWDEELMNSKSSIPKSRPSNDWGIPSRRAPAASKHWKHSERTLIDIGPWSPT